MKFNILPRSGLKVSQIGFGSWTVGTSWWGARSDDESLALIGAAIDAGMTFINTGDAYGEGRSEELVGQAIADCRDRITLGTQFGYDIYNAPAKRDGSRHGERPQDFSPPFIRKALEHSLRRLRTDVIDLYQTHNLKLPQFSDELFETLDRLRDEGKIRAWGVALGPAIGWREEGIAALADRRADAVMTVFNMLEQDPGREFCEVAAQSGGAVLARVPHHSGILKDIYTADTKFEKGDHRNFRDRNWLTFGLRKVEALRPIAGDRRMTVGQLALKWLLAQPGLASCLPTITTPAEVREFAAAAEAEDLSAEELACIAEMYGRDFDLPPEAHPCDLKSSTSESGSVRSSYVKPLTSVS
ncbi:MAG: Aldo-keto reductase IolS [Phycisphaerae bacterium]|nr:Aldo-keto reductase IolS [Phycisphaerae bacterium]